MLQALHPYIAGFLTGPPKIFPPDWLSAFFTEKTVSTTVAWIFISPFLLKHQFKRC